MFQRYPTATVGGSPHVKETPVAIHMKYRIFEYPYVLRVIHSMLTPAVLFKSLADETRARATLLIAREGELCVCELMCALDDSQPKISRHLAQLRSSGLLLDRRQGQWVYYKLNPQLPAWVHQVLTLTLDANRLWLSEDSARLATMGDRPVRTTCC